MNAEDALQTWSAPCVLAKFESSIKYREDLLSLACRLPDVASRIILCPLFSQRLLQQLDHSPALDTLMLMCKRAIAQQQQQRKMKLVQDSRRMGGNQEESVAVDIVTFAAEITKGLLEHSVLRLDDALAPCVTLLQQGAIATLKTRLKEKVCRFSSLSAGKGKNFSPTSPRRIVSLFTQKKAVQSYRKPLNISQTCTVPSSMAVSKRIVQDVSDKERRQLLNQLDEVHPVLQVCSRAVIKRQLKSERSLERNTSLLATKGTTLVPSWKRRRSDDTIQPFVSGEKGGDGEKLAQESDATHCQDIPNATWVTEGELVLIKGRLVHVKKDERSVVSDSKNTNSRHVKMGATAKASSESSSQTDTNTKKSIAKPSRKVGQEVPRQGRQANTSQAVPLMSKEELMEMIQNLDISVRLRQTLLIGLGVTQTSQ
uniref:Uncharacterized protein n=1 Tax=Trypanosoma congolense (strain IL3000) TaxID=1068625 RepID=G0UXQ1_TRYCI|nr:conserved hypothetical protein [Trypanosoma congolense IL3000]